MTDSRFFHRCGPFTLGNLARKVDAELSDSASVALSIHGLAALNAAGPHELSFFYDSRYGDIFSTTRAGAVVTTRALSRYAPRATPLIVAMNPRLAYAEIGHMFYPAPAIVGGIDRGARVDPSAAIDVDCQIDAGAVIGPGVALGARCHVAANAVLGGNVVVGDDCRIGANTAISHAVIGSRVVIGTCVSIGGPGFGFVPTPQGLMRMPQLGRVVIEDDVNIDANCAIDRGAHGDTVIGRGTVIDNLVQIGHNVQVGRHCAIAGQAGIAGSTVIGDGVMIGGQAAISDHLTIGSGARIAGKSAVMRDVEKGVAVGGYPAIEIRQWHRQTVGLSRLLNRKPSDNGDAAKRPEAGALQATSPRQPADVDQVTAADDPKAVGGARKPRRVVS